MSYENKYIEYVLYSEKESYLRNHHDCLCNWGNDEDCDNCFLGRKLSEMPKAHAYFRYKKYFETDWHQTNLSLSDLLKSDDYLSCAKIIDEVA